MSLSFDSLDVEHLTQAQQPVAPIGVELAGVATWDREEIRRAYSYQEVEEDEKWVRLSDLEKLLALPQTEKGEEGEEEELDYPEIAFYMDGEKIVSKHERLSVAEVKALSGVG